MREFAMLPIGSRVIHHTMGEGVVIGYFRSDAEWHLIEFIKISTRMHNGHSSGVGKNGERVVGKDGQCFYLTSLSFDPVEDFDGNL